VSTRIDQPLVHGGSQPGYNMLSSAPGPLVRAGDFLRLNATTTGVSGALALNGRLLTLGGAVVPFSRSLTLSGAGNQTSVAVPLPDGWIIGFDVYVSSGTITEGQVVASVEVVQGTGTAATRVMSLASGGVTSTRGLGLGGYTANASLGMLTVVSVANPAAGAEISVTVPANERWELLALLFTFTTSATAANRTPAIQIGDGTNTAVRVIYHSTIAASIALAMAWATTGSNAYAAGLRSITPLPVGLTMEAGWIVSTSTALIQVDDQYSAITLTYRLLLG